MKSIIINSIESEVVFRPGNSVHAKYYAIITLNQTILSLREADVANKLLNLYFAVFTSLLKKDQKIMAIDVNATSLGTHTNKFRENKPPLQKRGKMNRKALLRVEAEQKGEQFAEEMNAKLISAVLTGVNRAFPFSQVDDEVFQKHMDTLFRITHSGNFNTSIQALMLIFQVANSKQVYLFYPSLPLPNGRLIVEGNRRCQIDSTVRSTTHFLTNVLSPRRNRRCTLTSCLRPSKAIHR